MFDDLRFHSPLTWGHGSLRQVQLSKARSSAAVFVECSPESSESCTGLPLRGGHFSGNPPSSEDQFSYFSGVLSSFWHAWAVCSDKQLVFSRRGP
jgi:hypothetical protein